MFMFVRDLGKFLCFYTCIASLINFPYNNDTSIMIDGMFVTTNLSFYSHVYHKTCGFILEVVYAINIKNIPILHYSITCHSLIHLTLLGSMHFPLPKVIAMNSREHLCLYLLRVHVCAHVCV